MYIILHFMGRKTNAKTIETDKSKHTTYIKINCARQNFSKFIKNDPLRQLSGMMKIAKKTGLFIYHGSILGFIFISQSLEMPCQLWQECQNDILYEAVL